MTDDLTELQTKTSPSVKAYPFDEPPPEQAEVVYATGGAASLFFWRRMTPLSRQILIWGGITGAINFLFSLATIFLFAVLGNTTAKANQNAAVLDGAYCLSFIVPVALAFYAGMRATKREGTSRNGGMAGLASILLATLLGLIYTVVYLGFISDLQSLNGGYWASFGENLLLEVLIGFAVGYLGGSFSQRQRRRLEQQQQQEATPS